MISCDTNILFPAVDRGAENHARARTFLASQVANPEFCLCEQVLMELYGLLRNPTVCRNPLSAADAVAMIQGFRSNPYWRIVDVIPAPDAMEKVWLWAAAGDTAYRRIFDFRLAATLQQHDVREFATCNVKDFQPLGFRRVWNPLV